MSDEKRYLQQMIDDNDIDAAIDFCENLERALNEITETHIKFQVIVEPYNLNVKYPENVPALRMIDYTFQDICEWHLGGLLKFSQYSYNVETLARHIARRAGAELKI